MLVRPPARSGKIHVPGSLLKVSLQGASAGPHSVAVKFNNSFAGNISFKGQSPGVSTFNIPTAQVLPGANTVTLTSSGAFAQLSDLTVARVSELLDGVI